jgi:hypothetical protein
MFGYTAEEAIGQSVATLLLDASHIESALNDTNCGPMATDSVIWSQEY